MHAEVKVFVKAVRRKFFYKFRNKYVLEVGSKNINGSVRRYFWFCKQYTGVDIGAGKGVDIVGRLGEVKHMLTKYDTVISTEALEHDSEWHDTLMIMYDLLQNNGLLIMTCAGPHREEHGTTQAHSHCSPDTNGHYRNISVEDFERVLPPHLFSTYVLQYANGKSDLQFYGLKKDPPRITAQQIYHALVKSVK